MKHHAILTILLLFVIYWVTPQKVNHDSEITPFCTANGYIRMPPPKNYPFDYRLRVRMLYGSEKVPVENREFESDSVEGGKGITVHVPVSLRLEPATFTFDYMVEGRRKGENVKVLCARADDCEHRTGLLLRLGLGCASKTFANIKDYLMLFGITALSVAVVCAPFACYAAIGFFVKSIKKREHKFISIVVYLLFFVFVVYILSSGFFRSSPNGFSDGHAVATSKRTRFMTPSELRSFADPGDTILFKRFGYLHAGVIRRNDEYGFDVVHVDGSKVGPEEMPISASYRSIESPVSVIAGVDGLVCIDNALDSVLTPADRALIMERLDQAVGTIFRYHVVDNNCEHFASLMRYGRPMSPQIETSSHYTRKVLYAGTWIRSGSFNQSRNCSLDQERPRDPLSLIIQQFNACEPMQPFNLTGCLDCQAGPTLEYQCAGDTSFLFGKPRLDGKMVCRHFQIHTVCDSTRRVLRFAPQRQPDDAAAIERCWLLCSYDDQQYDAVRIDLQAQLVVLGDHTYDKWFRVASDAVSELKNKKTSAEEIAVNVSLIGAALGLLLGVLQIQRYIIWGRKLGRCFSRGGCFTQVLQELARGIISLLLGFLRKAGNLKQCIFRLEQGKELAAENSAAQRDCRTTEDSESPATREATLMVNPPPPVHPLFG